MRKSSLFELVLSVPKIRKFPFANNGRVDMAQAQFVAGGSWTGTEVHHTASAEFLFMPPAGGRRKRLDDAQAAMQATQDFFRSHRAFRLIEFSGREAEGSVLGTWQLESSEWNATLTLHMTKRPRGRIFAVLAITESLRGARSA